VASSLPRKKDERYGPFAQPPQASRHTPQLSRVRTRYGWVVLCRRAKRRWWASLAWTASKWSWLPRGGTWATKIQSAGGVIREYRLWPTDRKADCRARASTRGVRRA